MCVCLFPSHHACQARRDGRAEPKSSLKFVFCVTATSYFIYQQNVLLISTHNWFVYALVLTNTFYKLVKRFAPLRYLRRDVISKSFIIVLGLLLGM